MSAVASAPSAAPPTLAPPPGSPRYEHLDALRGTAALSVIVIHLSAFVGMDRTSVLGVMIGRMSACVAVFFVLSGFLLYRPFVAERIAGGRHQPFSRYARGRALRILPAYWVALTLLSIWPGLNGVSGGDAWRYYGLLQGYTEDRTLSGIPPSWTLCVEVAFYLALPLVVLALAHRRPRTQLLALGLAALASLALRVALVGSGRAIVVLQTFPGLVAWFAGGMALAVISAARRDRPIGLVVRRPWLPWGVAGLAYAAICLVRLSPSHDPADYTALQELAEHVLYLVIAIGLALPAIFGAGERGPRRLLSIRAIAWIGVVSYGTYLWHWPLLAELQRLGLHGWLELGPVGLVGSYALGTASYYVVERPALTLKDRRAARRHADGLAARQRNTSTP